MTREPFATPIALVVQGWRGRVRVSVRALMLAQIGDRGEVFATDGAEMGLQAEVAVTMQPEQVALLEHLAVKKVINNWASAFSLRERK